METKNYTKSEIIEGITNLGGKEFLTGKETKSELISIWGELSKSVTSEEPIENSTKEILEEKPEPEDNLPEPELIEVDSKDYVKARYEAQKAFYENAGLTNRLRHLKAKYSYLED